MTLLVAAAILGLFLLFLAAGAANVAKHRMHKYGWFLYVWRWFTGTHWDGHVMTNAGWRRRGTKAITSTGYAPRFYFLPRWKRALLRTGGTVGTPLVMVSLAFGLLVDRRTTVAALLALAVAILSLGAWKAYRAAQARALSRDWLEPMHKACAPIADVPLSVRPSSWLEVKPDRSRAVLHLPAGYHDSERQQEQLVSTAAKKLGMESPEVTWRLSGGEPSVTLSSKNMPTEPVRLDDIIKHVTRAARDTLVLGLGRHSSPVEVSLHQDSPHVGASMGSGAGKSTLARLIAAQALHKGAIVMILDIKQISHPWARDLPNVSYCDTPEMIHEGLVWLGAELDRRNKVARISSDYEGNVSANVGPRLIIIAEELNMTANRLRSYWVETLGQKGTSPALMALQDVAFAGRQVLMNLVTIGQMLTARVVGGTSGGNEARENIGVRMLARHTKRNWDMLVPEHPMPPASKELGRIQVVASGAVRETQVAYLTGTQARELALSGEVALLPAGMPGAPVLPDPRINQKVLESPKSQDEQPVSPETSDEPVTFAPIPVTVSEAIDQGILKGNIHTVRSWRRLDPKFPKPVDTPIGGKSTAHYYNPVELADYQAGRGKKLCSFS